MPTIHDKLKMAYVHQHPDDGLMLSVTAAKTGQQFDLVLTPKLAAMLLGQLTQGVKDVLNAMDKPQMEKAQ